MIAMERSRSVSSIASLLSNDTSAPNTNNPGGTISQNSVPSVSMSATTPIEICEEENRNAVLSTKKDDVASHALLMLQDSKLPRSSSSSALNEKTESETPFRHWKKRSMPFPSPSSRTPSPPTSDPMYLNSAAQMASVNAINSLNTNFNSNFSISGMGGGIGSVLAPNKRIQFESAGTYGLQRNVPFLLRNSSIWRPGILPTPTTSSATSTRIISNLLPSTSTSTYEYVRLHFPNEICATDEVTRRNRNQKGCPSPITMHPTPSATASIIDLRVEFKVYVVKDGKRDRDPANEVKDVFVVREHSSKLIRKGEELQISVRFHRLPSDFISSSREFVFYLTFHRAIKEDKPDSLLKSTKSTNSKTPQESFSSGPMEFDSEIILHSKSRTKPGQSAKEAAAERESLRLAQEREAARQASSALPPLIGKSPVPAVWNKTIGASSFSSPSSSPNISPRECTSPRNPGSPPFDPASVVYNLRTSGVGIHVQVPIADTYDEGNSKKRLRTLTPLKESPRDNRSEKEKSDSLNVWKVFLEELNFEDTAGIASILVAEKIEIHQLSSVKFEALRSLGFLVGDIIRMIDYSNQFLAKHPELPRPSKTLNQSIESVNQISSQMSSIQLNRSSSNVIPIPSSIEPSPSVSPSNTYERFEEDHPRSRSGSLEQNASERGKDSLSKVRAPEDEEEDNALQIVDEGEDKEIVECSEERKSAFSVPVVSSPCNLRIHPRADAIYDAQEALLQLLNSPPRQRNPIKTVGKSPLSFSSSSVPMPRDESGEQTTGLSPSFQKAMGIRDSLRGLPPNEIVSYVKETIKIVQRFADKMVSKISNTTNLDQELADRTKEMHNVLRHLESCLSLCTPYSRPFSLDEIETSNRTFGGGSSAGAYSSESDSSPLTGRTRAFGNKNVPSDNDTDGDFDLDDEDVSDTEGSQSEACQPLAYYVGVIKAHLELRRVDLGRKSGLKRDVLKKEYVLVPIEEASRVLGISTTKLSRAYKNLSILSKCGWLFKGRRRRLRWPTRPLRVLLKYICDKYLTDLIQNYSNDTSNMMDIEKTTTSITRSYSLDQIVHH